MYQILKVLNNNTILVKEGNDELILMAKGIGFGKKSNEIINVPTNVKKYLLQKSYQGRVESKKVVDYIDPIYFELTDEILKVAAKAFGHVNLDILVPLADHIFYAIKRMDEDILPSNPFFNDIRLLFPEEYEVALKAKEIIEHYVHISINEDEVSFITLHIHSAVSNNKVGESMEAIRVVKESINKLERDLNIKIDEQSISYARLMNHIKFLIVRLNKHEVLQMNITAFTKEKFPFAYENAVNMCNALSKVLHTELPDAEIGYLALHLERILTSVFSS